MDQGTLSLQKSLAADERLVFQHQYDDEKRSHIIGAVIALSPFGLFGLHWFWLGNRNRGFLYLGLFGGGILLTVVFVGFLLTLGVLVACIIDTIQMGDITRKYNRQIGKTTFDAVVAMREKTHPASQEATSMPPLPPR